MTDNGIHVRDVLMLVLIVVAFSIVIMILMKASRTDVVENSMNGFCDTVCKSALDKDGYYRNDRLDYNDCFCNDVNGDIKINLSNLEFK